MGTDNSEVNKLKNHLSLLREEYVKLQGKHNELERKYAIAVAASGGVVDEQSPDSDSFVAKLLNTVSNLFDQEDYSDIMIKLPENKELKGHKFILAARSNEWGSDDLAVASSIDLSAFKTDVGITLMRWVYTDVIHMPDDVIDVDGFTLQLMKAASVFKLNALRNRCEKSLMSSITVANCIRFYEVADEISATVLRDHCSNLISAHWNDFTAKDFAAMGAPLLFTVFKSKTSHPLHQAIRAEREDVVFLFLLENQKRLPGILNDVDSRGDVPLDLALQLKLDSIAESLISHGCDLNCVLDPTENRRLLHQSIIRGDEHAATFLVNHGADVNLITSLGHETPLHLAAAFFSEEASKTAGMGRVAGLLLSKGANPNIFDSANHQTPLHRAVASDNEPVFRTLVVDHKSSVDLDARDAENRVSLWLALEVARKRYCSEEEIEAGSFAALLVENGASSQIIQDLGTSDSLLHLAVKSSFQAGAMFLVNHGANLNHVNVRGESALHLAAFKDMSLLVELMLRNKANPNLQTKPHGDVVARENHRPRMTESKKTNAKKKRDPDNPFDEDEDNEEEKKFHVNQIEYKEESSSSEVYGETPLHVAIRQSSVSAIEVLLSCRASPSDSGPTIDFDLSDSKGQTPLGLALWAGLRDVALKLLNYGADVDQCDAKGFSLLHQAIEREDVISALFLIEHSADVQRLTVADGRTPLQLAIQHCLAEVVDGLCLNGATLNTLDANGDCPLWQALESGQEDIASILVINGCDLNMWGPGPGKCQQTLLHRAIDENNEASTCFLIRSGCDIDATRRPGPNGEGSEEAADGQTPLHMCCAWGLDQAVQTLVEHNAQVNAVDADGKTPIHIAIENCHPVIISLLMSHPSLDLTIRDKTGFTPFAAAMTTRNNKAASAILDRKPDAAEQLDKKGRNFLHIAVQKSDIESVLFLISVQVNVNSAIQDGSRTTPLHIATNTGSEIIVRNMILAGADINAIDSEKKNALHLASSGDYASISSVLIQEGIDVNALDDKLNNALHLAVKEGNIGVVRVLLTESNIDAEAVNMKGQTPMHCLGQYGKDNAAAIFDLFLECMPKYPLDTPDGEGNTVLLLAYQKGNTNLCKSVVRSGACMGKTNAAGLSIFNYPVATKQLLFKLLDMLPVEPPWVTEGDNCLECGARFSLTTRKHHCRHCGRLLCAKCSEKDMPIVKYNLTKPVRVCDTCFDVLTLGSAL